MVHIYILSHSLPQERRCNRNMSSFKETFPKNHRPLIDELEEYWDNDMVILLKNFADYIMQNFDLRFGIPVWSEKNGWTTVFTPCLPFICTC